MFRTLAQGLLQLVYPRLCGVCAASVSDADFCDVCRAALTTDPHESCFRCASTVGPLLGQNDCSRCREERYHFDRAIRMGPYEGVLRDVILCSKHPSGETTAAMLGRLWAECIAPRAREFDAHFVIPVPLHWRRRLARGHNQSELLSEALAKQLRVPMRHRWLRRVRNTPPQTTQTPAGRRLNPRGAFACRARAELKDCHVVLVDDVLTTGTTCSEAARTLLSAGAARVYVAIVAHAQA